jgi:hypothetical protein
MVPIPADPKRVLEDESACEAVPEESLSNRHTPAGAAFLSLRGLSEQNISSPETENETESIDD